MSLAIEWNNKKKFTNKQGLTNKQMCIYNSIKQAIHIHYQSKVFSIPQKCLFLILKVLFLMKQVKLQNIFIYHTK